MERKVLEVIGMLAVGIVAVIGIFSIVGFDQIIESIFQMNPFYYALVIVVIILSMLVWSLRWGIFVRKSNPEVSRWDLFKIMFVGQAMNNLTPVFKMGGEAGRIYLLKRKYKIKVNEGLASISTDLILEFIVDMVLVFSAVILLMVLKSPPVWIYTILLVFLLVCSLIIFVIVEIYFDMKIIHKFIDFLFTKIKRLNKYRDHVFERYDSFRKNFRESLADRKRFAEGFSLSVGRKGLTIVKYYILLAAFGYNIGLVNIVIAIGLGLMLLMIPATPGNLGIYEGGMISVFIFVGVSPGVAATAVFLDRLVWFWGITAVGGSLGSKYGLELISEKVTDKY
ncbi:MAG: flippase-like domain-containing protein [Candidatus Thermoplasmatota archaeon]